MARITTTSNIINFFHQEIVTFKNYTKDRYRVLKSFALDETTSKIQKIAIFAFFIIGVAFINYINLLLPTISLALTLSYLNNTFFHSNIPYPCGLNDMINQAKKINKGPKLADDYLKGLGDLKDLKDEFPELNDAEKELVQHFEQFYKSDYKENQREQLEYKNDNRPAILYLRAKEDWNGAFENPHITLNGDDTKEVNELKKKYKFILIDNITKIDDIQSGMEKITNPIYQVFFSAHGTPKSMYLDKKNKLNTKNIEEISKIFQEKLTPDAHVILHSCNTGKKIKGAENIAQKFSTILPGRTIWAPTAPPNYIDIHLNENAQKVIFKSVKSRLSFLIELIVNFLKFCPSKKIDLTYDITTKFKDGIEIPI